MNTPQSSETSWWTVFWNRDNDDDRVRLRYTVARVSKRVRGDVAMHRSKRRDWRER